MTLGEARTWPLLCVGWITTTLLFFGLLVTGVLGDAATVALDDYACTVAPLAAALGCFRACRQTQRDRRTRRAWLLLGLSLLSWAAGGLVWSVYEVHLGRPMPFPSIADVGYLLSVPLAVSALLAFPGARFTGAARLRPVLDGIVAAGALLFVSWVTVLRPAFDAATGTALPEQLISMAYPLGDVLNATIALLAVARARGDQRLVMWLIGLGLLLVAVADSSFAWFSLHDAYATGNLFDTGYVAGFLLIALAALRRPVVTATDAPSEDASSGLALSLPYVPLVVTVPFAVALHQRDMPIDPFLFYTGLAVILAVLGRQLLTLQANVSLGHRLQDTVAVLRRREAELRHQAFHDPLTGLANRALFAERVTHALQSRRPTPVVLLLADLDDFKVVNDTLGHPAGDELLIGVAERLRTVLRPEDTVARLGGDEFAVLLEGAGGLSGAQRVADRIATSLLPAFALAGGRTTIGASIGIATAGSREPGEPWADTLLRQADMAMYAAKAEGKGRSAVFAPDMATANIRRLQLTTDLSQALSRGELTLVYQPIVDIDTREIRAVEALLRWTHPLLGAISPMEFIPLAEASGEILPIGRWVLETACRQTTAWHRNLPPHLGALELCVNLSARQLADPRLLPAVHEALAMSGLSSHLLTLELTESLLLQQDAAAMESLLELRRVGVRLAIDDFGTGHSSLSRLQRYPIDTLKVDKSFVAALTPDAQVPDVLLSAIMALSRGLGMAVVAEGVETEHQVAALRALGCQRAQGFLFARPEAPGVIGERIAAGSALQTSSIE